MLPERDAGKPEQFRRLLVAYHLSPVHFAPPSAFIAMRTICAAAVLGFGSHLMSHNFAASAFVRSKVQRTLPSFSFLSYMSFAPLRVITRHDKKTDLPHGDLPAP